MRDGGGATLAERAGAYDGSDPGLNELLELLATGLSNAVNFTRVSRLVIAGELTAYHAFTRALTDRVRVLTLHELERRLRVDLWGRTEAQPARIAASLVLAHMYTSRWATLMTVDGELQDTSLTLAGQVDAAPTVSMDG